MNLKASGIHQQANGSRRTATLDQVRPMSKRTSIYALAAVAALGITALAPTSASAYVPHGPMGVSVKPHGPMGIVIKPHPPIVTGIVIKPHPPIVTGIIIPPKPHPWPPFHWCKWHYCGPHWVPPMVVGGGGVIGTGAVATAPAAPVVSAPAAPCTCLTKTYLQDGSVLFKDVCTNEAAAATPEDAKALAQGGATQLR
jgi:hypothetical protein